MPKPVAVYDNEGHLAKVHFFPEEKCNVDDAHDKVTIRTKSQMLATILLISKSKQLCEHEYEE